MEKVIRYKKELNTIKNYIEIYPNVPKYKISAYTGISLDIIRELIEEGYLREEQGELKLATRGSMNNEERKNLIQRLSVETLNHGVKKQQESQLVIDLRNKKYGTLDKDDWER